MSGKHAAPKHGKPKKPTNTPAAANDQPQDPNTTITQDAPRQPLTPDQKKLITVIILAAAAVLTAIGIAIAIVMTNAKPQSDGVAATTAQATTSAPTAISTTAPATETTTGSGEDKQENSGSTDASGQEDNNTEASGSGKSETTSAPEALTNALAQSGRSTDDLYGSQLIVVDSGGGTSATVSYYQKNGGKWEAPASMPSVSGFVGSGGVGQASESLSVTPAGLFNITTAFGFDATIDTGLPYFQVTENTYYVDDPNSKYYNQHVEGTEDMDWQSAEHMIDYPSNYNYGFVFDYNTDPVVKGAGSAFFMHVNTMPTHGCVAVSQDDMIKTLSWLDQQYSPCILIL